jgi:hypothetical protein
VTHETVSRSKGVRDALLWVLVDNERAERFYGGDGWLPDGTRRVEEVHGTTVEEGRYQRRLP